MKKIKKILVIRFKQIGDSVLSISLCNTLKKSFPDAEVHFVINKGFSTLYEGHPYINKLITFDNEENHSIIKYVGKVWILMRQEKYDIIVDMRSTVRTLIFSLFSPTTYWRIGKRKSYSYPILRFTEDNNAPELTIDMVERDLMLLKPLEKKYDINYQKEFPLFISEEERNNYREYIKSKGIDFSHPILLLGVTTKLPQKRWNPDFMRETIKKIINRYPDYQLIFNYAKGEEEIEARKLYADLGSPASVKIDVKASTLRELIALCSCCSFYFGNEGGSRHIAQAMGVASFSIFCPEVRKLKWLPKNSIVAEGVEVADIIKDNDMLEKMSFQEQFNSITVDEVWERVVPYLDNLI